MSTGNKNHPAVLPASCWGEFFSMEDGDFTRGLLTTLEGILGSAPSRDKPEAEGRASRSHLSHCSTSPSLPPFPFLPSLDQDLRATVPHCR